jgi:methylmalonyl-CoA mutase C-terminal domain/subunit
MEKMREAGIENKIVIIGGNIPERDIVPLKGLGVQGVFPTGSGFDRIAAFIRESVSEFEEVK